MKTQHTFLLRLFALSLTGCLAAALAPVSAWADPLLRTVRASVSSTGAQGNGNSSGPNLAAYGRFVAFTSDAGNLVAGDHNGLNDIFVRDLETGRTKRVSVSSAGVEGNGGSYSPLISASGRYVVFLSDANNLVADDDNEEKDIFVRDTQTGVTRRVFLDPFDNPVKEGPRIIVLGGLSDNGRFVAFAFASYSVIDDGYEGGAEFVSDLKTGVTRAELYPGNALVPTIPTLSGDGRFVATVAYSNHFCVGSSDSEVFLRDLKTDELRCVLGSTNFYDSPYNLTLSANGQFLAYSFQDGLTFKTDVFVEDINTLVKRLVSANRAGIAGNGNSSNNDLSANGRFVAFTSLASDLVTRDNNGAPDVFVRDLKAGVTRRVSVDNTGRQGNKGSGGFYINGLGNVALTGSGSSLSADGRLVAFTSDASNLVKGDTNGKTDVFVRLWRR